MNHSLQSNEAAPAGSGNSTLSRNDGETRQTCAHCRAEIVDGHWFCRLSGDKEPALLCSPPCALRYFDHTRVQRDGSNPEWASDEHQFHFFVNGEQP